jgi:hypothetical protein
LSLARALSSRPASHLPVLPVRKLLHRHRKVFNQRGILHVHNSGGRVPAPFVSETSCGGVAATRVPTSIANLTALTSLDLAATASERGGARCSRASSASPASPASRLELTSSSCGMSFRPQRNVLAASLKVNTSARQVNQLLCCSSQQQPGNAHGSAGMLAAAARDGHGRYRRRGRFAASRLTVLR